MQGKPLHDTFGLDDRTHVRLKLEELGILRVANCEPACVGNARQVMDVAARANELGQFVLNVKVVAT